MTLVKHVSPFSYSGILICKAKTSLRNYQIPLLSSQNYLLQMTLWHDMYMQQHSECLPQKSKGLSHKTVNLFLEPRTSTCGVNSLSLEYKSLSLEPERLSIETESFYLNECRMDHVALNVDIVEGILDTLSQY